jgi:hypothetical protein
MGGRDAASRPWRPVASCRREAEAWGGESWENRSKSFFLTNQWQWWVISPNFTRSSLVEHSLRYSTKSMELGPTLLFFSIYVVEQLKLDVFG